MRWCRGGWRSGIAALAVAGAGCGGDSSSPGAAAYVLSKVNPCDTGSGIACEVTSGRYHWAYAPRDPDNRLAVFLPGTGGSPEGYEKLAQALAGAGLHVIVLTYRNDTAAFGLCDGERLSDPDCFRKFRHEVTFGAGVADPAGTARASDKVAVTRDDSAMNRLLHAVNWLAVNRVGEGWSQFQDPAAWNATYSQYNLVWPSTSVGGHSQGSGVALYLGKFFALDGVAVISGPQDGWSEGGAFYSPNWIAEGGFQTLLGDIKAFNHATEEAGLTAMQAANWTSLGLPGALVDSDAESPPYGGSSRLQTSLAPAGCAPAPFHSSTATDACTPGNPPAHRPVWLYQFGN